MTTIVPVDVTTRRPGRLVRGAVYAVGVLVAAALAATLIVVAINGNLWGLLTVPAGAAVGVAFWYVGHLLETRRNRSAGY